MGRAVITGSADQSIRFWAYDSAGAAVAGEAHDSAGMAVSVVVRSAGRIVSTTALTLVARSGVGVHTDSALTEVGGGEYVVDLPDSYSATAGRDISLTVASTAITGAVLVETLSVANDPSGGGSGTESDLMVSTTIDTLTSQTVFTLTAGSADNDAYNRQLVVITDAATSTQKARGIVSDYVGDTKTITLTGAPAFEIAAGDSISIIAVGSDVSSTQVLSAVSSAIVSAGITTTVTGMPTFLRVGDARTEANGAAIPVRLYNVDDDSLLFGLGDNLFADATITFSLRRAGTDSAEGAEDAAIPCTWVEDGADGYVQIAYEGDALDDCDAMDRLKEKDCHRWGIKFQWGTDDPITPIYGNISILRKIVTTQS